MVRNITITTFAITALTATPPSGGRGLSRAGADEGFTFEQLQIGGVFRFFLI